MLKTFKKARTRCPIVFYEEIIAVFSNEQDLKMTPKMTKKPKFSSFQSFSAISVTISSPWIRMLKTFIRVKIRCPVVFYEEIIAFSDVLKLLLRNIQFWAF